MRMAQREVGTDRAADGAARVTEALDAETVEGGQQPVGEFTDGGGRVGGGAAVARQVEAEDPPVLGELRYLPVPHVPGGAERGADDEDGGVLRPVEPVLQGVHRLRVGGLPGRGGLRRWRGLHGWRLSARRHRLQVRGLERGVLGLHVRRRRRCGLRSVERIHRLEMQPGLRALHGSVRIHGLQTRERLHRLRPLERLRRWCGLRPREGLRGLRGLRLTHIAHSLQVSERPVGFWSGWPQTRHIRQGMPDRSCRH